MPRHIRTIHTPTGDLSVLFTVAQQLLKQGVVTGDLDTDTLKATDAAIVRAAIIASGGLCDFCAAPGPTHFIDVPDFEMPKGVGRSTGGWAACDTCYDLVTKGHRKALLERSIGGLSFSKFTKSAVEELHARFWYGVTVKAQTTEMGATIGDLLEDRNRLPGGESPRPFSNSREGRLHELARVFNMTPEQIEQVARNEMTPETTERLVQWSAEFGKGNESQMRRFIEERVRPRKPLPNLVPHWQHALDMKFAAQMKLTEVIAQVHRRSFYSPESVDVMNPAEMKRVLRDASRAKEIEDLGFHNDVKFLSAAETFSFNADTIAAIREAASTLPHEAPLSSIETPNTGAGWFWFAEPIPVASAPVGEVTHAMLWGWGETKSAKIQIPEHYLTRIPLELQERLLTLSHKALLTVNSVKEFSALSGNTLGSEEVRDLGEILKAMDLSEEEYNGMVVNETMPSLTFSSYVRDDGGQFLKPGEIAPSTRWVWPFQMSLTEMVEYNGRAYERNYGSGQPLPHSIKLSGKEDTLKVVEQMSLFFLMACLWFKQTVPGKGKPPVLVTSPGHIERHARKRYTKEFKLNALPQVQVVALRRTAKSDPSESPERHEGARNYQCRWIVKGHPRLQAVGPGRAERKLIWIEAHPAGPEGKPFRQRERVFAVVR